MKEGDIRVARVDPLNYGVQTCKMKKNKDGEEIGLVWENYGYYGDHLDWAFNRALMLGMPQDQAVTPELVREVAKSITVMK